jgi:prepilin-type N-terminal cleavage/methylation domain-containing protein
MGLNEMKRGFTLNELMIVVVVVGILLVIVLPQLTKVLDRARESATKTNLSSFKTAIATYYGDEEVWPNGDKLGNGDGVLTEPEMAAALVPDYLETIPYVILRRGVPKRKSNAIYTNQMPFSCPNHGIMCEGTNPGVCPEHGTITDDGGWWYHVGKHMLRVNSRQRDTAGVFYSDYGYE